MVLELYYFPPSPPSRMVYMTLKALGLDFQIKTIDIMKGEQKTPEYLAINPRGKIPSLKDGDYVIAESRAIAAYLCNQYEKGDDSKRLYPHDAKARGKVDQLLYVSENTSDMIMSYVNVGGVLFRGENTKEDKIDEVHKALALCEGYLAENAYMTGDHLTIADFFMASPLLLLGMPGFTDFQSYPKTTAWLKKIRDLPYFDDTHKEGHGMLQQRYKDAIQKHSQ